MHLVFTASYDVTTDMLVERMGAKLLRLNNDRPHDHDIQINEGGFEIADKFGRMVNDRTLVTAFLRKPAPKCHEKGDEALHAFRETTSAHNALLQLISFRWPEKLPLNPSKMRDTGKFVQLHVAKSFLRTAPWAFTTVPEKSGLEQDVVLKTLHGQAFSEGTNEKDCRFIFVQLTKLSELADNWPWFIQEKIDARFDLTVLYVDGATFALRLDRNNFEGLDWRKHIGTEMDRAWERVELPLRLASDIDGYMRALGLRFGRLDFLANNKDLTDALFLEVNPNGQWGWMDTEMNNGIFDAVVDFLCRPS